jgi:cytochrome c oxidase subunit 3
MAVAAPVHHGQHVDRLFLNRIGLWFFFFSESILFGLLLSARFYLLRLSIPFEVMEDGSLHQLVDQQLGLIITIILLLSSVTAFTAETAIEHDRRALAKWMLFATIVLGLVFAAGVGYEWHEAEFEKRSAFGTVFFTMTGIHAAHVISGIGMLALSWSMLLRGGFSSKSHWGISGTVMYWHFVDVVWVFFYPALYLVDKV